MRSLISRFAATDLGPITVAYKPGYQMPGRWQIDGIRMVPFEGTRKERLEYLSRLIYPRDCDTPNQGELAKELALEFYEEVNALVNTEGALSREEGAIAGSIRWEVARLAVDPEFVLSLEERQKRMRAYIEQELKQ